MVELSILTGDFIHLTEGRRAVELSILTGDFIGGQGGELVLGLPGLHRHITLVPVSFQASTSIWGPPPAGNTTFPTAGTTTAAVETVGHSSHVAGMG